MTDPDVIATAWIRNFCRDGYCGGCHSDIGPDRDHQPDCPTPIIGSLLAHCAAQEAQHDLSDVEAKLVDRAEQAEAQSATLQDELDRLRTKQAGDERELFGLEAQITSHDHGNCELCDEVAARLKEAEAQIATLTTENDGLRLDVGAAIQERDALIHHLGLDQQAHQDLIRRSDQWRVDLSNCMDERDRAEAQIAALRQELAARS